ncbi:TOPRIM nucleotidyl transferase/hydrolase domain-containing protein [Leifsonia sp. NPDC058194]|uniref:TOPRIM nucleotidyl transferase/hydrolase domain-containing protein n=1 Tax=Leifsonia sp. NPDC058194 TaxID=3346374 RepID=UPI0036D88F93
MTETAPVGEEAAVAALERATAEWAAGGDEPRPAQIASVRVVVLVEGASDRAAVHAAAGVLGRDPAAEGTAVVPMGGAMSIRRFAGVFAKGGGPTGPRGAPELRGLCDVAERRFYERAGLADSAIAVCDPDLEGELIEALGLPATEEVLARAGDLRLFRTFQNQPAQRSRPEAAQLHRFFGTTAGRKEQYGRLLTAALPPARLPRPLLTVLGALRPRA